jgi:hypothetical protein
MKVEISDDQYPTLWWFRDMTERALEHPKAGPVPVLTRWPPFGSSFARVGSFLRAAQVTLPKCHYRRPRAADT